MPDTPPATSRCSDLGASAWSAPIVVTAVAAPRGPHDDPSAAPEDGIIEVGPRGFPSLSWSRNPVSFRGSSTLRLSVPADNTALGSSAFITNRADWPAGMTVDCPAGWSFHDLGPLRALVTRLLTAGTVDFVFTFGSVETSIDPSWIASSGGATPVTASSPLVIAPGAHA